ncbi:MAG TPA: ammonium transporter [Jatrophihabitans sp.]|jgi:Amt family ammonium transporter|uniref:ammonium transporter n=1 Tax=Jatrophihabitans sp. TaxID=1932789 RepID=UPI002E001E64|nr:ammonium transporter [Jatrophihabitans sp.]
MPIDSGDTAWVLISTALVLFMTPGLALFYGGMVRSKHVLSMLAQNFAIIAVVSVVWALVGFSLAFSGDAGGGLIGNLHLVGLGHANEALPGIHLTVPPTAYAGFQMMFAVITTALLTGAGADRMRFGPFLVFSVVWVLVVYVPLAHWAFSPHGWLFHQGLLDFAGGTVVEIDAGASALALVLVLGKRRGWPGEPMAPHSLPLTLLGAGILWFGWFGFNAGSALASGHLAAQALIGTHLAGCGGLIGWMALEKRATGHATTLGAASGAVAGLVAITPAAGYVNSLGAIVIGLLAGAAGLYAVRLKFRHGYDDSLDVVGVHGVCGVVGTLAVGVLATRTVNPVGRGLIDGGGLHLLGVQALGVVVAAAWAFVMTGVIALGVHKVLGLRATPEDELAGLDMAVHAETAYDHGAFGAR